MSDTVVGAQSIDRIIPVGYAIPAGIADEKELQNLGQLADETLQDPIKMQRLSELIFNCMRQDMAYGQERNGIGTICGHVSYGRRF